MAAKGKQENIPQAAITPNEAVVAEEGKQPEADLLSIDTGTGEAGNDLITPDAPNTDNTENSVVAATEATGAAEATEEKPAPLTLTAKEAKAAAKKEADAKAKAEKEAAEQAKKEAETKESKELTFPLKAVIHNNTPSLRAFPELGKQSASEIEAYAQNVAVTFSNQQMLDTFVGNLAQLRELNGWKGKVGVLLEGI